MAQYTESSVQSLDWKEHIRKRPGMYIGKLGDGSDPDDGIYVLIKEVVDNAIDEHVMGFGKSIDVQIEGGEVHIRDYGRGIPLGRLVDCVSKMNTGAKYTSGAFKKSVGLNGVGTKAVNALSETFRIRSVRDGKAREAEFVRGHCMRPGRTRPATVADGPNGTWVSFKPDPDLFVDYRFRLGIVHELLWHYAYLNKGLTLKCNEQRFEAKHGLLDLLQKKLDGESTRYEPLHFVGSDIEIAMTHGEGASDQYYSFVNGQYTTMGGTHQAALRESLIKSVREFYQKNFESQDIRAGLSCAISVRIDEPIFESQTKTKLGSLRTSSDGPTLKAWVGEFLGKHLDVALHKHKAVAAALLKRIQESEKERKELAGIRKLARERNRKAGVFNKKLRDCKVHFDTKHAKRQETTLFITEGDSASGSITKARSSQTQAVFSLRGKPLNTFGMSKKVVYQNEELNLLQHALNLEDIDGQDTSRIRYNRIVLATDADVDGMHIRLLLLTFFLQFYPEVVEQGHVFILETPLFRVRDKSATHYCYDDREKTRALQSLKGKPETTRFKGLGEISPDEFAQFIGKDMRLRPVQFPRHERDVKQTLRFYMGKNSMEKQGFIIDNLRLVEA